MFWDTVEAARAWKCPFGMTDEITRKSVCPVQYHGTITVLKSSTWHDVSRFKKHLAAHEKLYNAARNTLQPSTASTPAYVCAGATEQDNWKCPIFDGFHGTNNRDEFSKHGTGVHGAWSYYKSADSANPQCVVPFVTDPGRRTY